MIEPDAMLDDIDRRVKDALDLQGYNDVVGATKSGISCHVYIERAAADYHDHPERWSDDQVQRLASLVHLLVTTVFAKLHVITVTVKTADDKCLDSFAEAFGPEIAGMVLGHEDDPAATVTVRINGVEHSSFNNNELLGEH